MNNLTFYHHEVPEFLCDFIETPFFQRLKHIGMNCGCEYTEYPRFRNLQEYSRFDHSIGVALIVWHFTGDKAQSIAGLLHDIATPAFAHSVDFMHGDYMTQESTENGTAGLIACSSEFQRALNKHSLTTDIVKDYHIYPIADNNAPGLSADRLEYTIGNAINYGICNADECRILYNDIMVGTNESGSEELMFKNAEKAEHFALAALKCSEIYVADEDRYAMQMLSELLADAISAKVISENDLYIDEMHVIKLLNSDLLFSKKWQTFRSLHRIVRSESNYGGYWRQIYAKKRYIDPYVCNQGRISSLSTQIYEQLEEFKSRNQDHWICDAEFA